MGSSRPFYRAPALKYNLSGSGRLCIRYPPERTPLCHNTRTEDVPRGEEYRKNYIKYPIITIEPDCLKPPRRLNYLTHCVGEFKSFELDRMSTDVDSHFKGVTLMTEDRAGDRVHDEPEGKYIEKRGLYAYP